MHMQGMIDASTLSCMICSKLIMDGSITGGKLQYRDFDFIRHSRSMFGKQRLRLVTDSMAGSAFVKAALHSPGCYYLYSELEPIQYSMHACTYMGGVDVLVQPLLVQYKPQGIQGFYWCLEARLILLTVGMVTVYIIAQAIASIRIRIRSKQSCVRNCGIGLGRGVPRFVGRNSVLIPALAR